MEGLSCTELANFMLDNGISESVIDNFVTNETTHSKNYYIFSMSKRSCQYTPNNTYNDCAVDNYMHYTCIPILVLYKHVIVSTYNVY